MVVPWAKLVMLYRPMANTGRSIRIILSLNQAIRVRAVRYFGQLVDLESVIAAAIAPLAEQVIAEATQLWNGAAGLDVILVAGGGAHLVGPAVKTHFRHAQVIAGDPVFANALGYHRFAARLTRG